MTESKKNTLVSIIVPCYNHGAFLSEALDSVLLQTISDWECIIVNNGSTDNSEAVAKSYLEKDSRFKYFFQENKGVSSARNFAIANASGEYILPLDADDKIGKNYLEKGITLLKNQPLLKVIYCNAELFGELSGRWNLPPFKMQEFLIENKIFCSAIYRKSDFQKTKGYDEQMKSGFEDWEFWITMIDNESQVYRIPEVLFYYRVRQGSRNDAIVLNLDLQQQLREYIYDKHKEAYLKYCPVPFLTQQIANLEVELIRARNKKSFFGKAISKLKSFLR